MNIKLKFVYPVIMITAHLVTTELGASYNEITGSNECLNKAYAAIDVYDSRKSEKKEGSYNIDSRKSYIDEYEKIEDKNLLHIIEEQLLKALKSGNPYAAQNLAKFHISQEMNQEIESTKAEGINGGIPNNLSEDTKNKLIVILEESLEIKKKNLIKNSFYADLNLLITLKGQSTKKVEDIKLVELFDKVKAINLYSEILDDNPEATDAFQALLSLQQHEESWIPIAEAYIKGGDANKGLDFFKKVFELSDNPDNREIAFEKLKEYRKNSNFSDQHRFQVAKILHEYGSKNKTSDEFDLSLDYYLLLNKDQRKQNENERILARLFHLAEVTEQVNLWGFKSSDWYKERADSLCKLVSIIYGPEIPYLNEMDLQPIIKMYMDAAEAGSKIAVDCLVELLPKNKYNHIAELSLVCVSQKNVDILNKLFNITNQEVLLVILSQMLDDKSDEYKKIRKTLEEMESLYPLALDLKILDLQEKLKNLETNIEKKSAGLQGEVNIAKLYLQNSRQEASNKYGPYHYTSDQTSFYRNKIEEKNKDLVDYMEKAGEQKKSAIKNIENIKQKKALLIENLPTEKLYDLANEYDLVCKAWGKLKLPWGYKRKFEEFYLSYPAMLEKSADKGFLPAVKDLCVLYTDKYDLKEMYGGNKSKKAEIYNEVLNVLTNNELTTGQKDELFKKILEKKI